jgi:N-acetylglucosamine kinase-like BadF-type ATPase
MNSRVYAGIDGGGTRTRLALTTGDGTILCVVEGECVSFVELGAELAQARLVRLWVKAWKAAGATPRRADGPFIGSGSVLAPTDEETYCQLVAAAGLADRASIWAGNDALNALAGGLEGRPGILLICGTGSVCFGRNAAGETWRAGGWGHLIDDAGSAYALAKAALLAAVRAADGRGPSTVLSNMARQHLGLADTRELYRRVHDGGGNRAEMAALAPLVAAAAEQANDAEAQRILRTGAGHLAEMVSTVCRRLGLDSPELYLTGGLIEQAVGYRQLFLDALASSIPKYSLAAGGFPPVLGAVLLAVRHATGKRPETDFLCPLRRTVGTWRDRENRAACQKLDEVLVKQRATAAEL